MVLKNNPDFNFLLNKKISKIWIFLTTDCNLKCSYCFVEKEKKSLNLASINNILDILFLSKGFHKKILIYGGEPLLEKTLLKQLVKLSKRKAVLFKKSIEFSIATNGILLDENILEFFKSNNIKVSISFSGNKFDNDEKRVNLGGFGTFDIVKKKTELALDFLKNENISILLTIDVDQVNNIFKNFKYLLEIGVKSINIEPVQTKIWNDNNIEKFKFELNNIFEFILEQIEKDNFIFLNKLCNLYSIFNNNNNNNNFDIFENELNFLPDGSFITNPLGYFENKNTLGNVYDGIFNYNFIKKEKSNPKKSNINFIIIEIRNSMIKNFLNKLIIKSKINPKIEKYLELSKNRLFE